MKFTNTKGHDIPDAKLHLAIQEAINAAVLLNSIVIPDKPVNYISQYQLDIMMTALGIQLAQTPKEVSPENKYPIILEYSIAMEGSRAGLFKLNALGEDF